LNASWQAAGDPQHHVTTAAVIPQAHSFKPIQDLKPFTLTFNHTPSELNDWITRFASYCVTSQIITRPIEQQQAFLLQNVNTSVWTIIKQQINDQNPVLEAGEDESCIAVLKNQFELCYPLIMCRFEFFKYTQERTQTYFDYFAKLHDLAAATAQLEDLDKNDYIIFCIITGINDKEVLNKLLSIPHDRFNLEEIECIAHSCKAAQAYIKLQDSSARSINN
jgi:hypothetical protein